MTDEVFSDNLDEASKADTEAAAAVEALPAEGEAVQAVAADQATDEQAQSEQDAPEEQTAETTEDEDTEQDAGAKAVVVPPDTEHFQIPMEALEKAITPNTRAIIVNSPNNPSGVVYSADTYEKLAALLERKSKEIGHPIYLISDEPYREIIYDGLPILYVPHIYKNTIVCYSYSKSLSLPGERIGYILVPPSAEKAAEVYTAVCGAGRSMGFVCAPHLFQDVILKCMGQTSDMNVYDENRKLLYNGLKEMGYDCVYPSGAFYLFVKSPEADAKAFSDKAKKLNLLIVPADSFGCPGFFYKFNYF